MRASRVSGTSSGGSQTWCAAGPWPTIRRTLRSSSDSCSPGCSTTTGSGSGSATSSFCTSEIVKGKIPCRWPPSSRRTRTREAAGGPDTYAALKRSIVVGSGLR